jgi:hypothetical protein
MELRSNRKELSKPVRCCFCSENESIVHLFFECVVAKVSWGYIFFKSVPYMYCIKIEVKFVTSPTTTTEQHKKHMDQ